MFFFASLTESKVIASPSLPTGWEKRLDKATQRYYYINHNNKKTQWEPPQGMKHQPQEKKGGHGFFTYNGLLPFGI
jgi:hypothetical protein